MDWSTITSGGQLTEKILTQAADTREDAYAFLDQVQKFNDPFKIEAWLIRLFISMASKDWVGGRITVEILFKDATTKGCSSFDCRIRLLIPLSDGIKAEAKKVNIKASYRAFRDALRDRRKLSPFMLDDGPNGPIGKFTLTAERPLSMPPPGGPEALRQKQEARLAKAGIKFRSMPPEMRQGLEEMKRNSPRAGRSEPPAKNAAQPKNAPRPTPPVRIPRPGNLPSDFVDLDHGWEEEGPTLRRPHK